MRPAAPWQKAALTRKRKAAARKANATKGPGGRSAATRKAWPTRTPWFGSTIRTGWFYCPSKPSNFEEMD